MRRVQTLIPFLLLAACGASNDEAPLQLGAQPDRLEVSPDGSISLLREDGLRLRFAPDAVHLGLVNEISDTHSFDPFWLDQEGGLFEAEPPPGLRWRVPTSAVAEQDGERIVVQLAYEGSTTAQVVLQQSAEGRFEMQILPDSGAPIGFIRVQARVDPEEGLYGLGGAPDHVMHRGFIRPMQMEPDLSIESANNEVHVPVPLLIGTQGWGLFVQSKRLGVFDVATESADLVQVTYGTAEESAAGLKVHLFSSAQAMDVLGHYYAVTAEPLLPAPWAYGPLIWRDENRDQAEVEDDVRRIRDLDLATSGIWIDRPYATAVNSFDFEPGMFPDPAGMIQTAHDAGLRVALWHTPYLEEATGPLRQEAEDKGYFPPKAGLRLNRWSDPIDFTNPEAYDWWQGLIRRYTALGIEGFKLDYGEDLLPGVGGARTEWGFSDGRTDRTMHYDFTRLYHQVYAETLPEAGSFLLCRTGRWGDQENVSVIWPGDLDADLSHFGDRVTDDAGDSYTAVGGLPTSIIMDLNLGASGFPFYGADTGGYRHSPPNKETWVRWVQQTTFSSVMQVGDSSSQPPWEFTADNGRDDEALQMYRRYARLHLRLYPYVWTHAQRLATTGHPISRALGLAHPELGVHPWDTYLFGGDILVAPVTEAGATSRQVNLPVGTWLSWWDGERVASAGAEVTVDAPLLQMPVFVRAGALVPMLRPTIDTLSPVRTATAVDSFDTDAGLLWVRVAPAADADRHEFEVYDGTELSQTTEDGVLKLSYMPGQTFTQGVVFEVYLEAAPTQVRAQADLPELFAADFEAASEGWRYAAGRLFVKVSGAAMVSVR